MDSCDIISSQIFELLKYPVICKYDTKEVLYIVEVFDVPFEDFDRVGKIIFDYSNDHVTQFGTFFCARVYGLRRSRRKTEQLIKELGKKDGTN